MRWYLQALTNYAVFSGRARRKEYWYFFLFYILILNVSTAIIAGVVIIANGAGSFSEKDLGIGLLTGVGLFYLLYLLSMLIPALTVAVRRMHDTDHSGWWVLCPIANVVFLFLNGTQGDNRFGPDPKATAASTVLAEPP